MEKKCKNCKHRYNLKKYDYSNGGCQSSDMPGFICMIFADENIAGWMYGLTEEAYCEGFDPDKSRFKPQ